MLKKKNDIISNRTLLLLGFALLLRYIVIGLTYLTRYFPFSLISEKYFFHYQNRDLTKVWDFIEDKSLGSGTYFSIKSVERDNYMFYFEGFFSYPKKERISAFFEKLRKKFGENNVYINQINRKRYRINFIKDAINSTATKNPQKNV